MEKNKSILGFCLTAEMCRLIGKVMEKYHFVYRSILVPEDSGSVPEEILDSVGFNPDIVILDKDIDKSFKEKIVNRFQGSPVICLPSLSGPAEVQSDKIRQISEPFKLSEFEEVILNLTNNKSDSDAN